MAAGTAIDAHVFTKRIKKSKKIRLSSKILGKNRRIFYMVIVRLGKAKASMQVRQKGKPMYFFAVGWYVWTALCFLYVTWACETCATCATWLEQQFDFAEMA